MSQSDITSNLSEDHEELDLTMTPCSACNQTSTTNEPMVGCDACNRWFHYRCVGATEAVKREKRWFCPEPVCQEAAKKQKKSGGKKNPARTTEKSNQVQITQEQKIKAMEEEYAKQMEEIENERLLREKEMELQRVLKEKRMQIEKDLREKELVQEKLLLDRALKAKTDNFEKMKTMRLSYQQCMDGLDQEMLNMKKDGESVEVPQPGPSAMKQIPARKLEPADDKLFRQKMVSTRMPEKMRRVSDHSSDDDDQEEDYSSDGECDGDNGEFVASGTSGNHTVTYGLGQPHVGPTRNQLAARSGVSKKLPVFTGKPEDCPLFYGTYVASNEACGFNDVENLV
ncbi:uncharacterized protein LOC134224033 [Armigeres subalbatus]|uniref:uncharacterized protein LOC134224033 n=1 Tax=Armigeres subalbatus TaxID=124917 RepID=UPI002ED52BA6